MSQNKIILPLWPNGAKENNGIIEPERIENQTYLLNISEASITVQMPEADKATRAVAIVCPGGGYSRQTIAHEGFQVANWLNEQGITAVVLKYRLPNGNHNIPLTDVKRTIQMVRSYASEWNIDTAKIAIIGFSAGGHLASTLGTHFDSGKPESIDPIERYSSRPNMMVLFYPVITMDSINSHSGSRKNLLGEKPKKEHELFFSNELQVKSDTPPTIIFLSDDDKIVSPINSVKFYNALKTKNIPASIHTFPTGGHGWGMRTTIPFYEEWRNILLNWFCDYRFI